MTHFLFLVADALPRGTNLFLLEQVLLIWLVTAALWAMQIFGWFDTFNTWCCTTIARWIGGASDDRD
ncbi:hypothetical protein [Gemmobacter sp.]|uniref:hypothetical protein n=1 Tax=Gemmobacter sp. TaxID=1898957 RepID=UPI002AFE0B1E|nr:hypothetical protein [Gemmobacter sp.]